MKEIFEQIEREREYQDKKWGSEFDDKNTMNDWVTFITKYATNAAMNKDATPSDFREDMIKVASIAVAAIESVDRNGKCADRHYD